MMERWIITLQDLQSEQDALYDFMYKNMERLEKRHIDFINKNINELENEIIEVENKIKGGDANDTRK